MNNAPENEAALSAEERAIVACPACGKGYRVHARLLGRRLICKHCRHQWRAESLLAGAAAPSPQPGSDALIRRVEQPSDSGQTALESEAAKSPGSSSIAIDMSWAGRRIGRYQAKSLLGYGGMGVVWRAHDDSLRRDVALKILSRTREDSGANGNKNVLNLDLFMQEARAVAKLQHPSVVGIYEVAEDQGHVFLSLELMEGGTLKEYVEAKGPIPPRQLFDWMSGPARALALAHRRGVIHRDIKPSNLMFDDHGHLKLMDFGLADVSNEEVSLRLRGRAVGSLGWIAPETAHGKGTTAQSDIYCMGLVMMYALTGKPFINATTRSEVIKQHRDPPELDLTPLKDLTPTGRSLLRRCLAIDPAERFQTAEELAEALAACAAENPAEMRERRRRGMSIAVAATVLGLLAGAALTLHYALKLINDHQRIQEPVAQEPGNAYSQVASEVDDPAETRTPAPPSSSEAGAAHARSNLSDQAIPWPQVLDGAAFQIVASARGEVYHRADADCGRKIYAVNLLVYDNVEQARADGRRPCPICTPDRVARRPGAMPDSGVKQGP